MLDIRVVCTTDAFELFAHRARGLRPGTDFRCDAPYHRNQGSRTHGDQGHTCAAPSIMADVVGNEEACAEADGNLRKTHDSRYGKIFAKFVQGKL